MAAKHGTTGGYQAHTRRRRTDPTHEACEDCKMAQRLYISSWRREKGAHMRVNWPIDMVEPGLYDGLGAAIARGFRENA